MTTVSVTAEQPLTPLAGGEQTAARVGFGAMGLTGPGAWGAPPDRAAAVALVRLAAELGAGIIDTADAYGPAISEELIGEALRPFGEVRVATKGGMLRPAAGQWQAMGVPEYLRQCVELSLRRLGRERIDLYYLHSIDPQVPLLDQLGVLDELRAEGKIARIGLCSTRVPEIAEARMLASLTAVQCPLSVFRRDNEPVLRYCARGNLVFVACSPLAGGLLAAADGRLAGLARDFGMTPAQLALSWLLHRAPQVLPVVATSSPEHLADNLATANFSLTGEQLDALSALDQ